MARILIGNIKGPRGPQGIQGIQGPVGPQGPQGPLPPLINNFLATEAGVGALDAVAGATLKAQLDEVNGDLNPIKSYASNADVVTTIRNLISSGQKYGIILFVGNTTGLPSELPSGNVAYIQPLGTDVIYLEYKWELHRYYGYIAANATAPIWDKYVLNSDFKNAKTIGTYSEVGIYATENVSKYNMLLFRIYVGSAYMFEFLPISVVLLFSDGGWVIGTENGRVTFRFETAASFQIADITDPNFKNITVYGL